MPRKRGEGHPQPASRERFPQLPCKRPCILDLSLCMFLSVTRLIPGWACVHKYICREPALIRREALQPFKALYPAVGCQKCLHLPQCKGDSSQYPINPIISIEGNQTSQLAWPQILRDFREVSSTRQSGHSPERQGKWGWVHMKDGGTRRVSDGG